jgi:hypothetical protein
MARRREARAGVRLVRSASGVGAMSPPRLADSAGDGAEDGCSGPGARLWSLLGQGAWLLGFAGTALCLSVIGFGAGVVALGAALVLGFLATIGRYGARPVALLIPARAQEGPPRLARRRGYLPGSLGIGEAGRVSIGTPGRKDRHAPG